jgi:hypothetical protein
MYNSKCHMHKKQHKLIDVQCVTTPLWEECENETHTLEMGTWESTGTLAISEFNCRDQNTSHWSIFYIIRKLPKRKCRKWARMSHLDIYNTSYDKKKGRELNWQFNSQPPKVGNRLDLEACMWSATHRWKAFNEGYKFALNLIPIESLSKKLWLHKLLKI